MNTTRYTIIGAGHGGKAMAAYLALMGFEVTLYNRTPKNIQLIQARGGIELESPPEYPSGFASLACVTSNLGKAIYQGDVIMVVVPAYAHRPIALAAAPYLRDGQIVILHPGRTLGAIEFQHMLRKAGCKADVIVAEAQTFVYASRSEGPARAKIFRVKDTVELAALPAIHTSYVLETIRPAYPQFVNGQSVLHTGLNNIGAIFHPTISLLNAGRIETSEEQFQFYREGVTPTVARVMEVIDRERITIAAALNVRAISAREWLKMAYNSYGDNLFEAIHNQSGYRGIYAPATLNHRYITEEIPMSLVPFVSLGRRYGVSTRGIESIVHLACIAHRTNYWRSGRTLKRLGIADLSVSELTHFVMEGEKPGEEVSIAAALFQPPLVHEEKSLSPPLPSRLPPLARDLEGIFPREGT